MKITNELKERLFKLKEEGKKQVEIANELGISVQLVNYWFNPEIRKKRIENAKLYFSKKPKLEKTKIYKSRNEYFREYIRKKYQEDPIFREKQKERCKLNQRKKRKKL